MVKLVPFETECELVETWVAEGKPEGMDPRQRFSALCPECGEWLTLAPDGASLFCRNGHEFNNWGTADYTLRKVNNLQSNNGPGKPGP